MAGGGRSEASPGKSTNAFVDRVPGGVGLVVGHVQVIEPVMTAGSRPISVQVWCIRAACGRSALVGRLGVRAGGRLPGPWRELGGVGVGQVTGRCRVARHVERSWSGR
jgi:hypothetical protein